MAYEIQKFILPTERVVGRKRGRDHGQLAKIRKSRK